MDDGKIIELFFERSEQAIIELSNKYGAICVIMIWLTGCAEQGNADQTRI